MNFVKRIPIFPTLLVLLAVGVMIRLGFWQLDRMHQKEIAIRDYQNAQSEPMVTDLNTARLIDYPTPYTRVRVQCERLVELRVVAGRNAAEQTGWAHHATCSYRGPSGGINERRIIAGWSKDFASITFSPGQITGVVVPDKANEPMFWHIVSDPPLAKLEANAKPDPKDLPNNHLSYAVQWFLFALTALVIYGLALRKRLAA
jgi:surfeit locus 1 family protein